MILVGDSLAMVVMGHDNTLAITVDEMLHHTRAVRRAVRRALVVADMPFGSYHGTVAEGVANAVRFVKEAGAEAVKIEGPRVELVAALTDAEIPVVAHLGLTPQSVHRMGGYRVQARTAETAMRLKADAVALAEAGAGAVVLEGIPREAAAAITAELTVPTIGIGAGPECDGQILVFHDLVNLSFSPQAKFVRRYADAAAMFRGAIERYREDVEHRTTRTWGTRAIRERSLGQTVLITGVLFISLSSSEAVQEHFHADPKEQNSNNHECCGFAIRRRFTIRFGQGHSEEHKGNAENPSPDSLHERRVRRSFPEKFIHAVAI
ncbi:3-methyl-2-oxobutanoate hydroxymethyltransferase [Terracidiphilus sp.]|uniref:3-methyl-2-oxobutanoate hydroxymethyltransferase n=1 Tax=Terracidiphilus sp. TaxID=1964191 RepID=UPI003C1DA46A